MKPRLNVVFDVPGLSYNDIGHAGICQTKACVGWGEWHILTMGKGCWVGMKGLWA